MKRFSTFFSVVLVAAVVLTGCDVLSSSDPVEGQMRVLLTDAPAEVNEGQMFMTDASAEDASAEITKAEVTILRLELIGNDDGVIVLSEQEQAFDLLELQNGVTAELADSSIPEGSYAQLRVVVDEEARLFFDDDSDTTLKVPSGTQTGIKILFPEVTIAADDDVVEIQLEFDVEESFVPGGASGVYIFKPVIKPDYVEVNGEQTEVANDEGDEDEGDDNGDDT